MLSYPLHYWNIAVHSLIIVLHPSAFSTSFLLPLSLFLHPFSSNESSSPCHRPTHSSPICLRLAFNNNNVGEREKLKSFIRGNNNQYTRWTSLLSLSRHQSSPLPHSHRGFEFHKPHLFNKTHSESYIYQLCMINTASPVITLRIYILGDIHVLMFFSKYTRGFNFLLWHNIFILWIGLSAAISIPFPLPLHGKSFTSWIKWKHTSLPRSTTLTVDGATPSTVSLTFHKLQLS